MRPYPVFLRLEGRRALLVGGSAVAAAAEARGLFVNAVDDAGALSLTANSVRATSEGDQTVAIHTGASRNFPLQAAWHPHC